MSYLLGYLRPFYPSWDDALAVDLVRQLELPPERRRRPLRGHHVSALHPGVDLDVCEGSIYALIGPNGAGKTTLIKTLLNILRPSSGRSELLGTDSRRLSPGELQRIGYVSENQKLPGHVIRQFETRVAGLGEFAVLEKQ